MQLRGDERRVVTVLFADLAHFTGLSENLDPESVKNLVDRCFAALAVDITNHGGRVDKVVGDAIVALFGAPVAHEDDAERAVRAALEMQKTVAGLQSELGLALQLRVGINTGEVLVGSIRAGGDYTAMGDVVNVASRLQTTARPGTVVVGQATYALTSGVFLYRGLGLQRARGRDEPVAVWEAVESLVPPGRRPRRSSAPLIGRDEELGLLRQAAATAFRRRRPMLSVVLGDPGIGKTRLTEELVDWAVESYGATVLEGRCVPYGEANPWWPVAEAVRQLCEIDPGDEAAQAKEKCRRTVGQLLSRSGSEVDQATAGLMHLLGYEDALPDVDPGRAQQEARRALHLVMAALSSRRPVLLVLSEVHWADDVVIELVDGLLSRAAGRAFCLVVTGRPELEDRWAPASGRHNQVLLKLDPLDTAAARLLALSLLDEKLPGRHAEAEALAEGLAERSGGNPFFLEELAALVGTEADALSATSLGTELPATLRGIVAARLDALPPSERALLEDAAVVGRSGSIRALAALGRSRGVDDVRTLLSSVSTRDLIGVEGGRWEFGSDVVREVLYETLTKAERARRHWMLATWIEEASTKANRGDEFLEQVAHHHASAAELATELGGTPGVPEDSAEVAVAALRRAAAWAMGRELLSSASALLNRAVSLVPAASAALYSQVLLERAQVRIQMRELSAADSDIRHVLESRDATLAPLALTLQGHLEQAEGRYEASAATLTRALAQWRRLGDREGEVHALRGAGMTSLLAGDTVRAEDQLVSALAIARDLGRRRDEAWALWTLSWVSFSNLRLDEAEQRLAEAAAAFRAAGDVGGLGWVRGLLGYIRLVQGRQQDAEELITGLVEDARDRGDRWALGMLLVLEASLRLWRGRVQEAIELAEEARSVFSTINDTPGRIRSLVPLARALAAAGRTEEAQRAAAQGATLASDPAIGSVERINSLLVSIELAVQIGDWRTAVASISALPYSDPPDPDREVTRAMALLQARRVAEAGERLEALAAAGSAPGQLPRVYASLALGRAAAGLPQEALEAASLALEAEPSPAYEDRITSLLARSFALHQLGDEEAAQEALRRATAEAGSTDDRLTWSLVRLAAGRLREAAGEPNGPEQTLAALTELRDMDAGFEGWDNLYQACLHPRRQAAPQAASPQ